MARVSLSILSSIALYDAVTAQSIVPTSASSTFPSCAVSCAVLLQAQTQCIPPAVATTNDLTYENCFCQSSLLSALYSTPDAICTSECTAESDRTELQTWFENFCSEVGQGIDPLTTTATTPTPTATTIVTITSTRPPTITATGTGSSATSATTSNKSWISTHWKWILMLGVLVVAFALLTWGAIWLKRRHRRKVEERRAAMSGFPPSNEKGGNRAATPDLWGPHQHMQHTNGFEYSNPSIMGSGAVAAASDGHTMKLRRRNVVLDRPNPDDTLRRAKPEEGSYLQRLNLKSYLSYQTEAGIEEGEVLTAIWKAKVTVSTRDGFGKSGEHGGKTMIKHEKLRIDEMKALMPPTFCIY
ncbi:hypothetical protein LTR10_015445 [Elasticomyces elasticus]|uniref:WSC domain-containing protein n=1 Tax=Exophiala sideris TaxID=1016849 RepID=A0ABR0J3W7_9EURO|nr:hypothetical protein LTR10_015445 [Elasticomyces elasticus]KAK5026964.1 hypothetical protein LTS07_007263 [Exophiala sideris]KAK5033968.1 hypothetical protein LTR13_006568 [Exophiala sideris]KAK5055758.1 hypothetical protein LTR69_008133 [Exophiala sideris]KAK5180910.1 hypothetical protein LTR44_006730 [Eurotiomycetes sp. CCFEE 6388]